MLKRAARDRRRQGDRGGDRRDQPRHRRRPGATGTARACRRSPRRTSPRRRWSAASGGSRTATSTTSSSPTTGPRRTSRPAARWSRSAAVTELRDARRAMISAGRPGHCAGPGRSPGSDRESTRSMLLELEGVSEAFGSVVAADERRSVARRPGEALGIIGPNGAGKTTLFNLIAGGAVAGRRRRSCSTAATSRARRRTSAASPASAARTRSRSRSRT